MRGARNGAAWLALAYRTTLPDAEALRIALGPGPDPGAFPRDVIEREAADLEALERLGARLVTIADAEYPRRLRGDEAPLLLQVAGRVSLLDAERVAFLAGARGEPARRLADVLDAGGRAVVVLSKGMLRAEGWLRALREPIDDGSLALVSAEPPRAGWGPLRDRRRDALLTKLSR
ncbi:MAG: hypothetical protein ACREID_07500 [Planctomycetota bacterium]